MKKCNDYCRITWSAEFSIYVEPVRHLAQRPSWTYRMAAGPLFTNKTPLIARFMGPTWVHVGPTGPRWSHVGPMNLAIWGPLSGIGIHTIDLSRSERLMCIAGIPILVRWHLFCECRPRFWVLLCVTLTMDTTLGEWLGEWLRYCSRL